MDEKKTVTKRAPKAATAEKSEKVKPTTTEKVVKVKAATTAEKVVKAKATTLKEEAVTPVKKTVSKKAVKATEKEKSPVVGTDNPAALSQWIAKLIDERKGENVVVIDISAKTVIADYFVIASASSTTAVKGLTDYVDEKLSKDFGIEPIRRDLDSKWTAVDYGSVIVHIFLDETREFYQLERLWSDGTNVSAFKGKN